MDSSYIRLKSNRSSVPRHQIDTKFFDVYDETRRITAQKKAFDDLSKYDTPSKIPTLSRSHTAGRPDSADARPTHAPTNASNLGGQSKKHDFKTSHSSSLSSSMTGSWDSAKDSYKQNHDVLKNKFTPSMSDHSKDQYVPGSYSARCSTTTEDSGIGLTSNRYRSSYEASQAGKVSTHVSSTQFEDCMSLETFELDRRVRKILDVTNRVSPVTPTLDRISPVVASFDECMTKLTTGDCVLNNYIPSPELARMLLNPNDVIAKMDFYTKEIIKVTTSTIEINLRNKRIAIMPYGVFCSPFYQGLYGKEKDEYYLNFICEKGERMGILSGDRSEKRQKEVYFTWYSAGFHSSDKLDELYHRYMYCLEDFMQTAKYSELYCTRGRFRQSRPEYIAKATPAWTSTEMNTCQSETTVQDRRIHLVEELRMASLNSPVEDLARARIDARRLAAALTPSPTCMQYTRTEVAGDPTYGVAAPVDTEQTLVADTWTNSPIVADDVSKPVPETPVPETLYVPDRVSRVIIESFPGYFPEGTRINPDTSEIEPPIEDVIRENAAYIAPPPYIPRPAYTTTPFITSEESVAEVPSHDIKPVPTIGSGMTIQERYSQASTSVPSSTYSQLRSVGIARTPEKDHQAYPSVASPAYSSVQSVGNAWTTGKDYSEASTSSPAYSSVPSVGNAWTTGKDYSEASTSSPAYSSVPSVGNAWTNGKDYSEASTSSPAYSSVPSVGNAWTNGKDYSEASTSSPAYSSVPSPSTACFSDPSADNRSTAGKDYSHEYPSVPCPAYSTLPSRDIVGTIGRDYSQAYSSLHSKAFSLVSSPVDTSVPTVDGAWTIEKDFDRKYASSEDACFSPLVNINTSSETMTEVATDVADTLRDTFTLSASIKMQRNPEEVYPVSCSVGIQADADEILRETGSNSVHAASQVESSTILEETKAYFRSETVGPKVTYNSVAVQVDSKSLLEETIELRFGSNAERFDSMDEKIQKMQDLLDMNSFVFVDVIPCSCKLPVSHDEERMTRSSAIPSPFDVEHTSIEGLADEDYPDPVMTSADSDKAEGIWEDLEVKSPKEDAKPSGKFIPADSKATAVKVAPAVEELSTAESEKDDDIWDDFGVESPPEDTGLLGEVGLVDSSLQINEDAPAIYIIKDDEYCDDVSRSSFQISCSETHSSSYSHSTSNVITNQTPDDEEDKSAESIIETESDLNGESELEDEMDVLDLDAGPKEDTRSLVEIAPSDTPVTADEDGSIAEMLSTADSDKDDNSWDDSELDCPQEQDSTPKDMVDIPDAANKDDRSVEVLSSTKLDKEDDFWHDSSPADEIKSRDKIAPVYCSGASIANWQPVASTSAVVCAECFKPKDESENTSSPVMESTSTKDEDADMMSESIIETENDFYSDSEIEDELNVLDLDADQKDDTKALDEVSLVDSTVTFGEDTLPIEIVSTVESNNKDDLCGDRPDSPKEDAKLLDDSVPAKSLVPAHKDTAAVEDVRAVDSDNNDDFWNDSSHTDEVKSVDNAVSVELPLAANESAEPVNGLSAAEAVEYDSVSSDFGDRGSTENVNLMDEIELEKMDTKPTEDDEESISESIIESENEFDCDSEIGGELKVLVLDANQDNVTKPLNEVTPLESPCPGMKNAAAAEIRSGKVFETENEVVNESNMCDLNAGLKDVLAPGRGSDEDEFQCSTLEPTRVSSDDQSFLRPPTEVVDETDKAGTQNLNNTIRSLKGKGVQWRSRKIPTKVELESGEEESQIYIFAPKRVAPPPPSSSESEESGTDEDQDKVGNEEKVDTKEVVWSDDEEEERKKVSDDREVKDKWAWLDEFSDKAIEYVDSDADITPTPPTEEYSIPEVENAGVILNGGILSNTKTKKILSGLNGEKKATKKSVKIGKHKLRVQFFEENAYGEQKDLQWEEHDWDEIPVRKMFMDPMTIPEEDRFPHYKMDYNIISAEEQVLRDTKYDQLSADEADDHYEEDFEEEVSADIIGSSLPLEEETNENTEDDIDSIASDVPELELDEFEDFDWEQNGTNLVKNKDQMTKGSKTQSETVATKPADSEVYSNPDEEANLAESDIETEDISIEEDVDYRNTGNVVWFDIERTETTQAKDPPKRSADSEDKSDLDEQASLAESDVQTEDISIEEDVDYRNTENVVWFDIERTKTTQAEDPPRRSADSEDKSDLDEEASLAESDVQTEDISIDQDVDYRNTENDVWFDIERTETTQAKDPPRRSADSEDKSDLDEEASLAESDVQTEDISIDQDVDYRNTENDVWFDIERTETTQAKDPPKRSADSEDKSDLDEEASLAESDVQTEDISIEEDVDYRNTENVVWFDIERTETTQAKDPPKRSADSEDKSDLDEQASLAERDVQTETEAKAKAVNKQSEATEAEVKCVNKLSESVAQVEDVNELSETEAKAKGAVAAAGIEPLELKPAALPFFLKPALGKSIGGLESRGVLPSLAGIGSNKQLPGLLGIEPIAQGKKKKKSKKAGKKKKKAQTESTECDIERKEVNDIVSVKSGDSLLTSESEQGYVDSVTGETVVNEVRVEGVNELSEIEVEVDVVKEPSQAQTHIEVVSGLSETNSSADIVNEQHESEVKAEAFHDLRETVIDENAKEAEDEIESEVKVEMEDIDKYSKANVKVKEGEIRQTLADVKETVAVTSPEVRVKSKMIEVRKSHNASTYSCEWQADADSSDDEIEAMLAMISQQYASNTVTPVLPSQAVEIAELKEEIAEEMVLPDIMQAEKDDVNGQSEIEVKGEVVNGLSDTKAAVDIRNATNETKTKVEDANELIEKEGIEATVEVEQNDTGAELADPSIFPLSKEIDDIQSEVDDIQSEVDDIQSEAEAEEKGLDELYDIFDATSLEDVPSSYSHSSRNKSYDSGDSYSFVGNELNETLASLPTAEYSMAEGSQQAPAYGLANPISDKPVSDGEVSRGDRPQESDIMEQNSTLTVSAPHEVQLSSDAFVEDFLNYTVQYVEKIEAAEVQDEEKIQTQTFNFKWQALEDKDKTGNAEIINCEEEKCSEIGNENGTESEDSDEEWSKALQETKPTEGLADIRGGSVSESCPSIEEDIGIISLELAQKRVVAFCEKLREDLPEQLLNKDMKLPSMSPELVEQFDDIELVDNWSLDSSDSWADDSQDEIMEIMKPLQGSFLDLTNEFNPNQNDEKMKIEAQSEPAESCPDKKEDTFINFMWQALEAGKKRSAVAPDKAVDNADKEIEFSRGRIVRTSSLRKAIESVASGQLRGSASNELLTQELSLAYTEQLSSGAFIDEFLKYTVKFEEEQRTTEAHHRQKATEEQDTQQETTEDQDKCKQKTTEDEDGKLSQTTTFRFKWKALEKKEKEKPKTEKLGVRSDTVSDEDKVLSATPENLSPCGLKTKEALTAEVQLPLEKLKAAFGSTVRRVLSDGEVVEGKSSTDSSIHAASKEPKHSLSSTSVKGQAFIPHDKYEEDQLGHSFNIAMKLPTVSPGVMNIAKQVRMADEGDLLQYQMHASVSLDDESDDEIIAIVNPLHENSPELKDHQLTEVSGENDMHAFSVGEQEMLEKRLPTREEAVGPEDLVTQGKEVPLSSDAFVEEFLHYTVDYEEKKRTAEDQNEEKVQTETFNFKWQALEDMQATKSVDRGKCVKPEEYDDSEQCLERDFKLPSRAPRVQNIAEQIRKMGEDMLPDSEQLGSSDSWEDVSESESDIDEAIIEIVNLNAVNEIIPDLVSEPDHGQSCKEKDNYNNNLNTTKRPTNMDKITTVLEDEKDQVEDSVERVFKLPSRSKRVWNIAEQIRKKDEDKLSDSEQLDSSDSWEDVSESESDPADEIIEIVNPDYEDGPELMAEADPMQHGEEEEDADMANNTKETQDTPAVSIDEMERATTPLIDDDFSCSLVCVSTSTLSGESFPDLPDDVMEYINEVYPGPVPSWDGTGVVQDIPSFRESFYMEAEENTKTRRGNAEESSKAVICRSEENADVANVDRYKGKPVEVKTARDSLEPNKITKEYTQYPAAKDRCEGNTAKDKTIEVKAAKDSSEFNPIKLSTHDPTAKDSCEDKTARDSPIGLAAKDSDDKKPVFVSEGRVNVSQQGTNSCRIEVAVTNDTKKDVSIRIIDEVDSVSESAEAPCVQRESHTPAPSEPAVENEIVDDENSWDEDSVSESAEAPCVQRESHTPAPSEPAVENEIVDDENSWDQDSVNESAEAPCVGKESHTPAPSEPAVENEIDDDENSWDEDSENESAEAPCVGKESHAPAPMESDVENEIVDDENSWDEDSQNESAEAPCVGKESHAPAPSEPAVENEIVDDENSWDEDSVNESAEAPCVGKESHTPAPSEPAVENEIVDDENSWDEDSVSESAEAPCVGKESHAPAPSEPAVENEIVDDENSWDEDSVSESAEAPCVQRESHTPAPSEPAIENEIVDDENSWDEDSVNESAEAPCVGKESHTPAPSEPAIENEIVDDENSWDENSVSESAEAPCVGKESHTPAPSEPAVENEIVDDENSWDEDSVSESAEAPCVGKESHAPAPSEPAVENEMVDDENSWDENSVSESAEAPCVGKESHTPAPSEPAVENEIVDDENSWDEDSVSESAEAPCVGKESHAPAPSEPAVENEIVNDENSWDEDSVSESAEAPCVGKESHTPAPSEPAVENEIVDDENSWDEDSVSESAEAPCVGKESHTPAPSEPAIENEIVDDENSWDEDSVNESAEAPCVGKESHTPAPSEPAVENEIVDDENSWDEDSVSESAEAPCVGKESHTPAPSEPALENEIVDDENSWDEDSVSESAEAPCVGKESHTPAPSEPAIENEIVDDENSWDEDSVSESAEAPCVGKESHTPAPSEPAVENEIVDDETSWDEDSNNSAAEIDEGNSLDEVNDISTDSRENHSSVSVIDNQEKSWDEGSINDVAAITLVTKENQVPCPSDPAFENSCKIEFAVAHCTDLRMKDAQETTSSVTEDIRCDEDQEMSVEVISTRDETGKKITDLSPLLGKNKAALPALGIGRRADPFGKKPLPDPFLMRTEENIPELGQKDAIEGAALEPSQDVLKQFVRQIDRTEEEKSTNCNLSSDIEERDLSPKTMTAIDRICSIFQELKEDRANRIDDMEQDDTSEHDQVHVPSSPSEMAVERSCKKESESVEEPEFLPGDQEICTSDDSQCSILWDKERRCYVLNPAKCDVLDGLDKGNGLKSASNKDSEKLKPAVPEIANRVDSSGKKWDEGSNIGSVSYETSDELKPQAPEIAQEADDFDEKKWDECSSSDMDSVSYEASEEMKSPPREIAREEDDFVKCEWDECSSSDMESVSYEASEEMKPPAPEVAKEAKDLVEKQWDERSLSDMDSLSYEDSEEMKPPAPEIPKEAKDLVEKQWDERSLSDMDSLSYEASEEMKPPAPEIGTMAESSERKLDEGSNIRFVSYEDSEGIKPQATSIFKKADLFAEKPAPDPFFMKPKDSDAQQRLTDPISGNSPKLKQGMQQKKRPDPFGEKPKPDPFFLKPKEVDAQQTKKEPNRPTELAQVGEKVILSKYSAALPSIQVAEPSNKATNGLGLLPISRPILNSLNDSEIINDSVHQRGSGGKPVFSTYKVLGAKRTQPPQVEQDPAKFLEQIGIQRSFDQRESDGMHLDSLDEQPRKSSKHGKAKRMEDKSKVIKHDPLNLKNGGEPKAHHDPTAPSQVEDQRYLVEDATVLVEQSLIKPQWNLGLVHDEQPAPSPPRQPKKKSYLQKYLERQRAAKHSDPGNKPIGTPPRVYSPQRYGQGSCSPRQVRSPAASVKATSSLARGPAALAKAEYCLKNSAYSKTSKTGIVASPSSREKKLHHDQADANAELAKVDAAKEIMMAEDDPRTEEESNENLLKAAAERVKADTRRFLKKSEKTDAVEKFSYVDQLKLFQAEAEQELIDLVEASEREAALQELNSPRRFLKKSEKPKASTPEPIAEQQVGWEVDGKFASIEELVIQMIPDQAKTWEELGHFVEPDKSEVPLQEQPPVVKNDPKRFLKKSGKAKTESTPMLCTTEPIQEPQEEWEDHGKFASAEDLMTPDHASAQQKLADLVESAQSKVPLQAQPSVGKNDPKRFLKKSGKDKTESIPKPFTPEPIQEPQEEWEDHGKFASAEDLMKSDHASAQQKLADLVESAQSNVPLQAQPSVGKNDPKRFLKKSGKDKTESIPKPFTPEPIQEPQEEWEDNGKFASAEDLMTPDHASAQQELADLVESAQSKVPLQEPSVAKNDPKRFLKKSGKDRTESIPKPFTPEPIQEPQEEWEDNGKFASAEDLMTPDHASAQQELADLVESAQSKVPLQAQPSVGKNDPKRFLKKSGKAIRGSMSKPCTPEARTQDRDQPFELEDDGRFAFSEELMMSGNAIAERELSAEWEEDERLAVADDLVMVQHPCAQQGLAAPWQDDERLAEELMRYEHFRNCENSEDDKRLTLEEEVEMLQQVCEQQGLSFDLEDDERLAYAKELMMLQYACAQQGLAVEWSDDERLIVAEGMMMLEHKRAQQELADQRQSAAPQKHLPSQESSIVKKDPKQFQKKKKSKTDDMAKPSAPETAQNPEQQVTSENVGKFSFANDLMAVERPSPQQVLADSAQLVIPQRNDYPEDLSLLGKNDPQRFLNKSKKPKTESMMKSFASEARKPDQVQENSCEVAKKFSLANDLMAVERPSPQRVLADCAQLVIPQRNDYPHDPFAPEARIQNPDQPVEWEDDGRSAFAEELMMLDHARAEQELADHRRRAAAQGNVPQQGKDPNRFLKKSGKSKKPSTEDVVVPDAQFPAEVEPIYDAEEAMLLENAQAQQMGNISIPQPLDSNIEEMQQDTTDDSEVDEYMKKAGWSGHYCRPDRAMAPPSLRNIDTDPQWEELDDPDLADKLPSVPNQFEHLPSTGPFLPMPPSGQFVPMPPLGATQFTPVPPSGRAQFTPVPPSGAAQFTPMPPSGAAQFTPMPPSDAAQFTPMPPSGAAQFTPMPPSGAAQFTHMLPSGAAQFAPKPPSLPSPGEHVPRERPRPSPRNIDHDFYGGEISLGALPDDVVQYLQEDFPHQMMPHHIEMRGHQGLEQFEDEYYEEVPMGATSMLAPPINMMRNVHPPPQRIEMIPDRPVVKMQNRENDLPPLGNKGQRPHTAALNRREMLQPIGGPSIPTNKKTMASQQSPLGPISPRGQSQNAILAPVPPKGAPQGHRRGNQGVVKRWPAQDFAEDRTIFMQQNGPGGMSRPIPPPRNVDKFSGGRQDTGGFPDPMVQRRHPHAVPPIVELGGHKRKERFHEESNRLPPFSGASVLAPPTWQDSLPSFKNNEQRPPPMAMRRQEMSLQPVNSPQKPLQSIKPRTESKAMMRQEMSLQPVNSPQTLLKPIKPRKETEAMMRQEMSLQPVNSPQTLLKPIKPRKETEAMRRQEMSLQPVNSPQTLLKPIKPRKETEAMRRQEMSLQPVNSPQTLLKPIKPRKETEAVRRQEMSLQSVKGPYKPLQSIKPRKETEAMRRQEMSLQPVNSPQKPLQSIKPRKETEAMRRQEMSLQPVNSPQTLLKPIKPRKETEAMMRQEMSLQPVNSPQTLLKPIKPRKETEAMMRQEMSLQPVKGPYKPLQPIKPRKETEAMRRQEMSLQSVNSPQTLLKPIKPRKETEAMRRQQMSLQSVNSPYKPLQPIKPKKETKQKTKK